MSRPQIKITLIDRKGPHGCHRGHKIGDSYDFDTERGRSVPWPCMWHFHMWIFLDMVEPSREMKPGTVVFCCPDVDTINVFRIEVVQPEQDKN